MPKLLGTNVGGLTGTFLERGGTIRSFEDEIRVSSCRLCELHWGGWRSFDHIQNMLEDNLYTRVPTYRSCSAATAADGGCQKAETYRKITETKAWSRKPTRSDSAGCYYCCCCDSVASGEIHRRGDCCSSRPYCSCRPKPWPATQYRCSECSVWRSAGWSWTGIRRR